MNIISVMTFGIFMLIVSKDVTASAADTLDFFRENQITIFERLRKLEGSDSALTPDHLFV